MPAVLPQSPAAEGRGCAADKMATLSAAPTPGPSQSLHGGPARRWVFVAWAASCCLFLSSRSTKEPQSWLLRHGRFWGVGEEELGRKTFATVELRVRLELLPLPRTQPCLSLPVLVPPAAHRGGGPMGRTQSGQAGLCAGLAFMSPPAPASPGKGKAFQARPGTSRKEAQRLGCFGVTPRASHRERPPRGAGRPFPGGTSGFPQPRR